MLTTILIIAIVIIVILAIKYYTGKNKSHSEKSGLEKIAQTVSSKANRTINEIAEAVRTPEEIKKELLETLENSFKELKANAISFTEGLLTVQSTSKTMLEDCNKNIKNVTTKAKEYKTKYLESNAPRDLEYANKYITRLINLENIAKSCTDKYNDCADKIEDVTFSYEEAKDKLNTKKLEIYNMVFDSNVDFKSVNQNLNEINRELRDALTKKNIKIEAVNIINQEEDISQTVSSSEVVDRFNKL